MTPSINERCTEMRHDEIKMSDLKASMRSATISAAMSDSVDAPPVADDYMYDFKYNHPLPTTDVLGIEIPKYCDAQHEADSLVKSLSVALHDGNAEAFADLFLDYGRLLCQRTFTPTLMSNLSPQVCGVISSRSPGTSVHSTFDQRFSKPPRTCSRKLKPATSTF